MNSDGVADEWMQARWMAVEAAELRRSVDDVTDLLMGMMDSLLDAHQPSVSPLQTPREPSDLAAAAKEQELLTLLLTLKETMTLDCQTFSETVNNICNPRLGLPAGAASASASAACSASVAGPSELTSGGSLRALAGHDHLQATLERSVSLPTASSGSRASAEREREGGGGGPADGGGRGGAGGGHVGCAA